MKRLLTAALVLAACGAPEEALPPRELDAAEVAAARATLNAATYNAADLSGNVGDWGVGVWMSERGVKFALTRWANDDVLQMLRFQCQTGLWILVGNHRPLERLAGGGAEQGHCVG